MNGVAHAVLDQDDRLVEADPLVTALNARAGATGDRLVLPPVLALARLARRLGSVIARPVRLADGERDLEVWLRAQPEGAGRVRLTLADWRTRPATSRRHQAPVGSNEPDEPDDSMVEPLLPATFAEPLRRALDRPVRRMVATAELLRADESPDVPQPYRDYARDIVQAGRHLQALLEDVAKLDGVSDPARIERIDLAEAARRAIDLLTVRAAARDIEVVVPGDQAFALGDFRRTLQIALNLIGNAINHSPVGGRVVVSTQVGPRVSMVVDDDGRGVPTDQRQRIFEQFVRLEPSASPGSGLGLTISRRLAATMAGEVDVAASPTGGARFTLHLPVSP